MMKVGGNYGYGWWVHANGIGYLRDDMTTHKGMTGSGGTYFKTREEAQTAADRFNNLSQETGTLQELNVKPGDVVECVEVFTANYTVGKTYKINRNGHTIQDCGEAVNGYISKFRIISRASDDTPKLWRDMTDAEKGELLLAHHRGEVIEVSGHGRRRWVTKQTDCFLGCNAYRIKPEPVRETVTLTGFHSNALGYCITFDTINGTPDPDSIKMERI